MKKNIGEIFLLAQIATWCFLPMRANAQTVASWQNSYREKMSIYRTHYAQFERDKQLYGLNQTDTNLKNLIDNASKSFAARQAVMVNYNHYLMSLLQQYSKNQDVNNQLNKRIASEISSLQNLQPVFDNVQAWNKADADFSDVMAVINETSYQAFAQIYWHEMQAIIDEFKTLYQNQNQRILDEAINKVDREQKMRVLDRTMRSLQSLQQKMEVAAEKLKTINGRENYVTFRTELNLILAELETSLKLYAGLE